jgi:hypothetical protein
VFGSKTWQLMLGLKQLSPQQLSVLICSIKYVQVHYSRFRWILGNTKKELYLSLCFYLRDDVKQVSMMAEPALALQAPKLKFSYKFFTILCAQNQSKIIIYSPKLYVRTDTWVDNKFFCCSVCSSCERKKTAGEKYVEILLLYNRENSYHNILDYDVVVW